MERALMSQPQWSARILPLRHKWARKAGRFSLHVSIGDKAKGWMFRSGRDLPEAIKMAQAWVKDQ